MTTKDRDRLARASEIAHSPGNAPTAPVRVGKPRAGLHETGATGALAGVLERVHVRTGEGFGRPAIWPGRWL